MAIKLMTQDVCDVSGDLICQFIIDSAEDVANLPECCTGSTAIVADKGGAIYMVNASGEWREQ